jgi:hypothetical protein
MKEVPSRGSASTLKMEAYLTQKMNALCSSKMSGDMWTIYGLYVVISLMIQLFIITVTHRTSSKKNLKSVLGMSIRKGQKISDTCWETTAQLLQVLEMNSSTFKLRIWHK